MKRETKYFDVELKPSCQGKAANPMSDQLDLVQQELGLFFLLIIVFYFNFLFILFIFMFA